MAAMTNTLPKIQEKSLVLNKNCAIGKTFEKLLTANGECGITIKTVVVQCQGRDG
jgi:hypothetical protein